MASVVSPVSAVTREHRFFLISAIAMAAVLVGGFSFNLVMGRSSFAAPLVYHLHAVVFMGWIALYVLQNALVAAGSLKWHRKLGWLALLWLPAMIALALAVTLTSIRSYGGPPFFDVNEFLIGNPAAIAYFAAVAGTAIVMRRRTDWHRRLMFCAMASITGPGFGRLLPMPFMIPWSWWAAALIAPSIFPIIGMVADYRRTGRIHRAWLWGWGAFVATFLTAELLAYSPLGYAITEAVIAGTPGADRPIAAHWP